MDAAAQVPVPAHHVEHAQRVVGEAVLVEQVREHAVIERLAAEVAQPLQVRRPGLALQRIGGRERRSGLGLDADQRRRLLKIPAQLGRDLLERSGW